MSNITIEGNLADEVDLRFTPGGDAVADLVIIENRRQKNRESGSWEDAPATRHRLVAWGSLAENAAESLSKGDRIVATGELFTEQWPDKDTGEARYSTKIKTTSLGVSLRFHTAQPVKAHQRASGDTQGDTGQG